MPIDITIDTLWIMGLHDDFNAGVDAVQAIDFSAYELEEVNVFETTIRVLGGLISAYDLSDRRYPALLEKATEVGNMLYKAFDTPNRMPVVRWNLKDAVKGTKQEAGDHVLAAELGSFTLEFTRLSQLTDNSKYYDAAQRVMDVFEREQSKTKLPGLWPHTLNARTGSFTDGSLFTIGRMVDSVYEYLPKASLSE